MRKDLGSGSYIYPMPVLVIGTYDADGNANAMTAAWGGIYDTGKLGIALGGDHKTTRLLLEKKEYTVSMATEDTAMKADFVGCFSGDEVPDKLERCGLTPEKAPHVDAPMFAELPMAVECRFVSYNEDGWLVGEIVNVSADESILGENGKIDAGKLRPVTYDSCSHTYRVLGPVVGQAYTSKL